MSEEEENNTGSLPPDPPPPPPPRAPSPPVRRLLGVPLTSDPMKWWQKWSTWCGIISAGCVGAFGFYALAPERAQNAVPDAILIGIMGLGMVSGFSVAVATRIRQKVPQS